MNNLSDDKKPAITFNELPEAVSELLERMSHIEKLLSGSPDVPETDELMDVAATSKFLNLSISTLYTKVCRGEIPALKPGKRLYFDKRELIEWIKSSRKKSNDEIRQEANFLLSKGRIPFHRKRRTMW
jgi:excisionase family DNA binding protein